jgi:hypothetical protein
LVKIFEIFHVPTFLVVKFYLVNYEYWFLVVSILLVGQLPWATMGYLELPWATTLGYLGLLALTDFFLNSCNDCFSSTILCRQLGVLVFSKTNTHSSLNRILLLKKSGREKFQKF